MLHIPNNGHGFHVFRRSGAIAAFGLNVDIENIKVHGNWNSDAIHTYLRSSISAPPAVHWAFQGWVWCLKSLGIYANCVSKILQMIHALFSLILANKSPLALTLCVRDNGFS